MSNTFKILEICYFARARGGQERGEREQRGTNADLRVSCSETYFAFTTARREKLSRLKELNEKKKKETTEEKDKGGGRRGEKNQDCMWRND